MKAVIRNLEGSDMKKFLSFLTLLLIALMLFVGCNNDIPTGEKPENGGTSIPSEEKPEEKP